MPERLERLIEAVPNVVGELILERVLQRIADLATEIIGSQYAAVGILGRDGHTLESFTTAGISTHDRDQIGSPPSGMGILGIVIRESHPLRLTDLTSHPARAGFPPNHPVMHSFLGVPILGRRRVLGNLYLTEKLGGAEFTTDDEHLATLLAAQAATAIENARLHEESARLLEEVQRLHRTRERFFAMVNHELRNALAGVYGWAEMLVRRKDPQSVPRAAYEVLDSAERTIELINDLLDLSRLDENRLKPVVREVDCGTIVQQAINRVVPAAQKRKIRIKPGVPADLPACQTDASRVEQILVNLLGNAVRHTPDHTSVRISLACEPPDVTFTVEDQGPGVSPDDVERIFDVYHTTARSEGQGSGLGLPLSRRLARLLGGDLEVVAQPGEGGRFILRLPAARVRH